MRPASFQNGVAVDGTWYDRTRYALNPRMSYFAPEPKSVAYDRRILQSRSDNAPGRRRPPFAQPEDDRVGAGAERGVDGRAARTACFKSLTFSRR